MAEHTIAAMMETVGVVTIVVGGGGLVLVGFFSLVSLLRSGSPGSTGAGVHEPDAQIARQAEEPPGAPRGIAGRPAATADELFSELFALRADVAALTVELRAVRQKLAATAGSHPATAEAPGDEPAAA